MRRPDPRLDAAVVPDEDFQYSIRDAHVLGLRDGGRGIGHFQYSIRDAALLVGELRQGLEPRAFNTLLEMLLQRAAHLAVTERTLSILY